MATVTGMSAGRMKQIEESSVISGLVDPYGNLILSTKGGEEINAGFVAGVGPPGAISMFAGTVAPEGHLICDGSEVSRAEFAVLFSVIGIRYGGGNGSTTFNIPNLKGRVPVGVDTSQTEFDTLGETGGSKTHTLTVDEMPRHTHVQNAHNHTQNSHTHSQNSHSHTQNSHNHNQSPHTHGQSSHSHDQNAHSHVQRGHGQNAFDASGGRYILGADASAVNSDRYSSDGTNESTAATTQSSTAENVAATAENLAATATNNNTAAGNNSATATNNSTTAVNQNTGNSQPHNNLQPYIVMNYIIKT